MMPNPASRIALEVALETDNIISRAICLRLRTDYIEKSALVDRLHMQHSPVGDTVFLDGHKICFIGKPVIMFDGEDWQWSLIHCIYED